MTAYVIVDINVTDPVRCEEYKSAEYSEPGSLRHQTAISNMVVVEGV